MGLGCMCAGWGWPGGEHARPGRCLAGAGISMVVATGAQAGALLCMAGFLIGVAEIAYHAAFPDS